MKFTPLTVILVLFLNCNKNEKDYEIIDSRFIQGNWEDYCNMCNTFESRTYDFEFYKDSFKMHKTHSSDALSTECFGYDYSNIYGKGLFHFDNNSLIIDGVYTDENFDILSSSVCLSEIPIGNYKFTFDDNYYQNDTLVLHNTNQNDWQGLIKLKRE